MADLPEFSPELSPEERAFLQQVRQWVKDDDQTIDFDTLRQKTPTDNKGIFWLSFAYELPVDVPRHRRNRGDYHGAIHDMR